MKPPIDAYFEKVEVRVHDLVYWCPLPTIGIFKRVKDGARSIGAVPAMDTLRHFSYRVVVIEGIRVLEEGFMVKAYKDVPEDVRDMVARVADAARIPSDLPDPLYLPRVKPISLA